MLALGVASLQLAGTLPAYFKLHQIILYLLTFVSVAFYHEMTCALYLIQLPTYESDISLIYHFIRGQGTIKLYVVYNVLEVS